MKKYRTIIIINVIVLTLIALGCYFFINNLYIVTYCDEKYNCTIKEENSRVNRLFSKYKKYKYVKVDKVIDEVYAYPDDLMMLISESDDEQFGYGLNINDKVRLLSEEVNVNKLVNIEKNELNKESIINYVKEKNIDLEDSDFDNIKVFTTQSYYKDPESKDIVSLKRFKGFNIDLPSDKKLDNVITNSINRLIAMLGDDGKFVYGYRANLGTVMPSYSNTRHAGASYSLVKYYEHTKDESLKEKIELSIDYLIKNCLVKRNNNTYYVIDDKKQEFILGTTSLTLLAITEYQIAFNETKYSDIAEGLANGIITFQQKDGSYIHSMNTDYTLKDEFIIVYYDGEATYALLNQYKVTKNKKYFDAAKAAVDMFISKNYTDYKDQWVAYSMYNFIQYDHSEKYIEFTFQNYTDNDFFKIDSFRPVNIELLMCIYNSYKYLVDNKIESDALGSIDLDDLKKTIIYHRDLVLSYYIDDYYAMYFKNPELSKYGFVCLDDNFRMRIDDIQHPIAGLIMYQEELK